MGLFRRSPKLGADQLFARWFRPQVPEGHASLEAFEAAIGADEQGRLPATLAKLALDGVERILHVRKVELDPGREGLSYMDELLGAELRLKLTEGQDPGHPRNLFRLLCIEFGCIVGEIYVRTDRGSWEPQRAPNLWRSRIRGKSGGMYDPFRAVVRQMSDERGENGLARDYDAFA